MIIRFYGSLGNFDFSIIGKVPGNY